MCSTNKEIKKENAWKKKNNALKNYIKFPFNTKMELKFCNYLFETDFICIKNF